LLSLIFITALAYGNLTEPESRLSCIDVHVRSSCALGHVTYESIVDGPTFINSCVGLTVLVGEGLWPYKRWSSPKILEDFVRTKFLFVLSREQLRLEGDPNTYGLSEIFCPAEAVDVKFLPQLRDQLGGRDVLRVGDLITEGSHAWLVDGLHINRSGYVYATLRDQENGQTIARTLN
jgi:hypothetical protein